MQNKKNLIRLCFLFLIAVFFTLPLQAQVTIGSLDPPKSTLDVVAGGAGSTVADGITAPRLTLAELNAKRSLYTAAQTGTFVYITDASGPTIAGYSDEIVCTGFAFWNGTKWLSDCATNAYGIITPRMTLAELNAKQSLYTVDQVGAFVYITDASGPTVAGYSDEIVCTGLTFWNGTKWVGDCAVKTFAAITAQPKAFTFYEQGTETVVPLVFGANGSSTMTYQWYKITGSNLHVRIAAPCTSSDGTGFNAASFTPTSVRKGTTRNANNCGFYKYYCIAKNLTGDSVVSNIAEVAVGCGAKDMTGEWVSFLCFNLGANLFTMAGQKAAVIYHGDYDSSTGLYSYVPGEEHLYGDLYQWGRIGDGHEKRNSLSVVYNAATPPTLENGNLLDGSEYYPYSQVSRSDATYYGKFIMVYTNSYNWYPDYSSNTNAADRLWRTGRNTPNDPCSKMKEDGLTYETWYPSASDPVSANTGWRMPSQDEWGNLYRGGVISGYHSNAQANTWSWYDKGDPADTNGVKGFEIKPDGLTTTLFLPATGYHDPFGGYLRNTGNYSHYWSSTASGSSALSLYFNRYSSVFPGYAAARTGGYALRCVKN